MNHPNDTLKILTEVIKKFFKKEELLITLDTTAMDIKEWDSLSHMGLIRAIEFEFKIEFEFFEVMDFENIDGLVKSIQQKM
ncbi:MAG: acyl carrier protein [Flavobacteriales bacterium]|nr:acyl carrier protein [Flavobacteriales bacterium]